MIPFLLSGAILLLVPATVAASEPETFTFNGGNLSGVVVDDAFTQGSFQNLTFAKENCGAKPSELTCTWEVRASVSFKTAPACAPAAPLSTVVWESGEQSGNSSVSSGPHGFPLGGCPEPVLTLAFKEERTYEPDSGGGWQTLRVGGSETLLQTVLGVRWRGEAEEAPRAGQAFVPNLHAPPTILIAPGCRSLTIGESHYSFVFRQMGCHKASALMRMAHVSRNSPSGYRCAARTSGGMRCSRKGHPRKFVEWRRLPPSPMGSR